MFPAAPALNDHHVESDRMFHFDGAAWQLGHSAVDLTDRGGRIGEIVTWFSATTPRRFLYCNGGHFDRTVYPELFGFLGDDHVPTIDDFLSQRIEGTAPGGRVRHALHAPVWPLKCQVSFSVASGNSHRHVAYHGKHIVGWRMTTSSLAFQTDDTESNRNWGVCHTSHEGSHHHVVSHHPNLTGVSGTPRPYCITARAVIRALI
jgi:hypothetical protein